MRKSFDKANLRGSSLLESVITLSIISICLGLALLVFSNAFTDMTIDKVKARAIAISVLSQVSDESPKMDTKQLGDYTVFIKKTTTTKVEGIWEIKISVTKNTDTVHYHYFKRSVVR